MEASPRPLAVVTGASSGIGLELARQFAQHGFDLVIAAEDEDIQTAARDLEALGGKVESVQTDLAEPEGVERLYDHVVAIGRPPNAAAINAGIGNGGPFKDTGLEGDLRLVDLNVRSAVHLAKLLVRDMAATGSGRILFTSSIASTQPGPFEATYAASKAFLQSFAHALREELKEDGIAVTSLMPGPTETAFFDRARMRDTRIGAMEHKDTAAEVARAGFEGLMAGKDQVVPGSLTNKVQARVGRFVPDAAKAAMHRLLSEPGSGR